MSNSDEDVVDEQKYSPNKVKSNYNTANYNKKNAPQELNPNNVLITRDIIQSLLGEYNVKEQIKNLDYYQLAFIHKSYVKDSDTIDDIEEIEDEITTDYVNKTTDDVIEAKNTTTAKVKNTEIIQFQDKPYERLEYIGDAILNAVIASYVFSRFPNEPEGFLTTLRTKLVRSQTLAKLTAKLRLQKWILISKHVEEKCNGRNNPKILEDIFEALVGALFLDFGEEDQGWRVCYKFIVSVFETFIDITTMIRKEDNYKRILLEFYQKKFHTEPKYQVISLRGPTNRRSYTMGALSPAGEIVGIGISRRKTDAEQSASKKALIYYKEDVDSDDSDKSDSE